MNKKSILFLSFLTASSVVYADMLLDADEAYYLKDFSTAFTICETLAEQGLVEAQVNLGDLYKNGKSVMRDNVEALK